MCKKAHINDCNYKFPWENISDIDITVLVIKNNNFTLLDFTVIFA